MKEIMEYLKARYMSEKAQGMVEYALIVAFVVGIAAVVFGSGGDLQQAVQGAFKKVTEKLNTI